MHGGSETTEARATRVARIEGILALLAVQLCFGLFPLVRKWAPGELTPKAIASWRIVVGSLALGGVAFARYGRAAWPRRGDWVRLQVCALLGIAVNMVLFLEGLQRSTAVNAGLIMPVIPVFTFAIAVALRQERFEALRGLGILLAFAGSLVLVLQRGPEISAEHQLGNVLMLINAFCYSWYLVLSRPLLARYPPLVVVAWVFLLSLWTVPLFARGETLWPAAAPARTWISLGYILVFATVAAYLLNTFALARVSASTTATYILLQPLITTSGGALWLGEPMLPGMLLAAALTFTGVWLVARRPAARVLAPSATSADTTLSQ